MAKKSPPAEQVEAVETAKHVETQPDSKPEIEEQKQSEKQKPIEQDTQLSEKIVLTYVKEKVEMIKTKIKKTHMAYRDNMRQMFVETLSKSEFTANNEEESTKLEKKLNGQYLKLLYDKSLELELELYKAFKMPNEYSKKARSLVFKLRDKKNPGLKH
jgi:transcription elongation factor S-II